MIRNIIFDFGGVLVDWSPRHLFDPYFNDKEKTDFFLENVCPYSWNATVDEGKTTAVATAERIALYPEWEKEIKMYYGEWLGMVGGQIEGMQDVVEDLKRRGYHLYGLTNWSAETFSLIRYNLPVFKLLEGIVVSGEEKINKPKPELYQILLSRYDIKPEESIFIDDNPDNVAAGEKLGIKGIVFTSREDLMDKLKATLEG